MPDADYLLYTPLLRSAHLERLRPFDEDGLTLRVLAADRHPDCDPVLLARPPVPVTFAPHHALEGVIRASPPAVLEVTEPLWATEWPRAIRLAAAARVARPGVRVVTYALDTLAPRGAAPRVDGVLDAVAYGNAGARQVYERVFGRPWSAATFEERRTACVDCFGLRPEAPVPAGGEVVFCAEFSARKGIDVLAEAWPRVADAGWCLRLLGHGPETGTVIRWAQARDDVEVTVRADRAAVHQALRSAAVVVLPSRRVRGWREQGGLSLIEGLAHGCRTVTTTETGLARGLDAEGHVVVEPDSAEALARGLRRALAEATPTKVLPSVAEDSRMRALRWLAAGSREQ